MTSVTSHQKPPGSKNSWRPKKSDIWIRLVFYCMRPKRLSKFCWKALFRFITGNQMGNWSFPKFEFEKCKKMESAEINWKIKWKVFLGKWLKQKKIKWNTNQNLFQGRDDRKKAKSTKQSSVTVTVQRCDWYPLIDKKLISFGWLIIDIFWLINIKQRYLSVTQPQLIKVTKQKRVYGKGFYLIIFCSKIIHTKT